MSDIRQAKKRAGAAVATEFVRAVGGFDMPPCAYCARETPCSCGETTCRCSCGRCLYPFPLPDDGPLETR